MPISSEFVGFIRETGVRAFDRLSLRAKDLDLPLRNFVRSWSKLSETEKGRLFDELVATIRTPPDVLDAPPPATPAKQKKAVKRYDPEEVAATLPRKPIVRKAAKSAAKKKSKPGKPV